MIVLLMLGMAVGAAAGSTATARAHLGSGNQLMQAERYAEAADEFQKALGDDHTLTKARDQLAICYFELRDYAHARPLLEQMLLDKNSAGVAAYYLGRIDLIDRDFDSAIRRLRSIPRENPVLDELYYLGSAYFKQEKYAEAELSFLAGYAGMNQREAVIRGSDRALLRRPIEELSELYLRWERPDQAASWKMHLAEFDRKEADRR